VVGNVDADLAAKYTVLAGCYCLLRYVENITGTSFAPHSIRFCFRSGTADRVSIDRRTAASLELISSLRNGNQRDSLYGALNSTCTVAGERLLRANLLRPLNELPTLKMRHSLVALLIRNARVAKDCTDLLRALPDLDFMLDGLCKLPSKVTDTVVVRSIDTMFMLRQALEIAGRLAITLKCISSDDGNSDGDELDNDGRELAAVIANALSPAASAELAAAVETALDPHAIYTKKRSELRHAECFAARTGVSGLLDLARTTYLASLDAMEAEAATYTEQLGRPVRLAFTTSRGHYLQLQSKTQELPVEFVQVVQGKRLMSCSTQRVAALSQRAQEALATALRLTYDCLQDIGRAARNYAEELFLLADSAALLDMLLAFAETVAQRPTSYVRPTLTTAPDARLRLIGARNPIVVNATAFASQAADGFVVNDLDIGPQSNLVIVSGPNGSGKSTYIRQAALCVIMAQVGMFIPAQQATIPLRDRIIARIGPSEDQEHNVSSFRGEMKELAYLASNITPKTLALLDELGRGTSHLDGVSLAFAAAEWLLARPAFSLFVTHFPQLSILPRMYPGARCIHMRTAGSNGLKFLHKIGDGPSALQTGYGVQMAKACGFPAEVVARAEALQGLVRVCHPLLLAQAPEDVHTAAGKLLRFLVLLGASSWQGSSLRKALSALRERIPSALETALLAQLCQVEESLSSSAPIAVSPQGAQSKKRALPAEDSDLSADESDAIA